MTEPKLLTEPPTEIEISELLNVMPTEHLAVPARMLIRRMAFERTMLRDKIAALQQRADAGAEALRVVAAVETLRRGGHTIHVRRPHPSASDEPEFQLATSKSNGYEAAEFFGGDTLLAALEQAVAAKGVGDV